MKYYTHILSLILSAAFLFQACSYLDVVPDETPDEKDAFQNPTMAERYLYSCYSFLPNPRHETASLDLMTADEVVTPWEHETFANFPKGNYNASEPVTVPLGEVRLVHIDGHDALDKRNRTVVLQKQEMVISDQEFRLSFVNPEIRLRHVGHCVDIFQQDVAPPDTSEKRIPVGDHRFAGVKGVMSIDMDKADFPERDSYDVCVQWISDLFDEAAGMLP